MLILAWGCPDIERVREPNLVPNLWQLLAQIKRIESRLRWKVDGQYVSGRCIWIVVESCLDELHERWRRRDAIHRAKCVGQRNALFDHFEFIRLWSSRKMVADFQQT